MQHRPPTPRRYALVAALLAAVLSAVGCSIEEPALPSFSTNVVLPLGTHDITVSELVEDEEFLAAGADSTLFFTVEGTTTSVALDPDLAVDVESMDLDAVLGPFTLDVASPAPFAFRLDELYPAVIGLPPVATPVPPFSFAVVSDPEPLAGVTSAVVESGTLSVALHNGLPVPASGTAPPELLSVELFDPYSGDVAARLEFPAEIAAGADAVAEADLAGVTLPGTVALRLAGGSSGDPGGVLVDPAAELAVTVTLSDLTVGEALAEIGPQSFVESGEIVLPDSLRIIEAVVESGALALSFDSDVALPCRAEIAFAGMVDAGGAPVVAALDLAPGGAGETTVDLAGARIVAGDGEPMDVLDWTVTVSTDGSGGVPAHVRAGDGIRATLAPTSIELGAVTGYIPQRTFAIDSLHEEIDIPDELDGVTLTAATLVVDILNGTGLAGDFELELVGRNAGGEQAVLTATAAVSAPEGGEKTALTRIVLDESNSEITAFLDVLPESFDLNGAVRVGGDEPGTVQPGDSAEITWRIDAPMHVVIDHSEIHRDPEPLDLDEDLRRDLDDHLLAGEIVVEITNRFPFAVDVLFQAGADSLSTLDAPDLVIGPLAVAPARIDPLTRFAAEAVVSRHTIPLSQEQIRVLTRENAHTGVIAVIPGTGGQEVRLRVGDYLSVIGAVRAEILVEDD